ncbi:hypothetical protein FGO68_gene6866 [Halteria grandinella]|uniref:N-acetyltransferase domain-containing protein n=1 Tax=Halteria grandinella TaxID=5974 RepID=A0A8J8T4M4_HALGN|nr:hypothetical protein FGO68_gene6866 [Halteria grandinella]
MKGQEKLIRNSAIDTLEIRHLTPDELPAAIRLTAKVHSEFEPFSHSIGSTYEDCVSLFTLLMGQFQEVAQIGAFKDGQLVGVSLNNDLYSTVPVKGDELSPVWEPIGAAMEGIKSKLEEEGVLVRKPGMQFHVYFVATTPDMKGQGISTKMLNMGLKMAADAGFQYSYIECINPGMVKAAQKVGISHSRPSIIQNLSTREDILLLILREIMGLKLAKLWDQSQSCTISSLILNYCNKFSVSTTQQRFDLNLLYLGLNLQISMYQTRSALNSYLLIFKSSHQCCTLWA